MIITPESKLEEGAAELLGRIGIERPFTLVPIRGGRNNRVFRVDTGGEAFFLKSYFSPPDDPRDRLNHEYGFTTFAWSCGIHSVARPLGCLPDLRLALYEYIHGKPADGRDSSMEDIRQAVRFILSLNTHRREPGARDLPSASEACFSLREHVENTEARVRRLSAIEISDECGRSADESVRRDLIPLWMETRERILSAADNGMCGRVLEFSERWISPSDFGFHNAIEEDEGRIRFIDFEYAGWDDPAKLLCDFANQPDRILDPELSGRFTEAIIGEDSRPDFLRFRYGLLEPLYQIKWACIILNDFLPSGKERRTFTLSDSAVSRRQDQLAKLAVMLERAGRSLSFIPKS